MRHSTSRESARKSGIVALSDYTRRLTAGDPAEADAMQRLLERMPVIACIFDLELRVTFLAGGGLQAISLDPRDAIGRDFYEIVGRIDRSDRFAEALHTALGGSATHLRTRGFGRFYEAFLEPVRGESGAITGVHTLALDQTESHAMGRALRRSDASLSQAQRLAKLGSWVYDPATSELSTSEEMRRIFDFPETSEPDARAFMRRMHPSDRGAVRESLVQAFLARRSGFGEDYRIVRSDGSVRWARQELEVLCDDLGTVKQISGTVLDVTDRKHLEEHLRHLAHFDALTGLPNRLSLSEELAKTFAADDLVVNRAAVLFIDVDRFKSVNDTLGHAAGDVLLKAVSERIKSCLRASDFVARAGGDEFVIVLTPLASSQDAQRLAERIITACSVPYMVCERELFCSVTIGISTVPDDAASPDEILRNADTAMYAAKAAGRNGYRFYIPSMHARTAERLVLENDLRRAIERDELFLQYQPIVAADGQVLAVEALVRWQHPTRGLLPPNLFIPIAEESGSIVPLGVWVLRSGCRDLQKMRELVPDLRLAVNLSARQFDDPNLLESFERAVAESGHDFTALEFEVTESVIMTDLEHAVRTLGAIKALGARVSIDDFGTGYSSLASLKRLPIDTLKIDQSFIADMPHDPDDVAIVTAIVGLGRTLDLCIVAEGVETSVQLEYLRSIGCDAMQGYHISRPLGSETMLVRLASEPPVPA